MKIITILSILFTSVFYSKNDKNYKCNFINNDATEISAIKYDYADSFSEDEITSIKCNAAESFKSGIIRVKLNGKYGLIDYCGKEILPAKYDFISDITCDNEIIVWLNNKVGFFNKEGKKVTPFKYDSAENFYEGLAKVKINGKYGYINKRGKQIIPAIYFDAVKFSEGLAMVGLKDGKHGFINKRGKVVIPFQYENSMETFAEGIVTICKNNKYGYIDRKGREIIPSQYDYAFSFFNENAVVKLNQKYGLINKSGKNVVEIKYDRIVWPFYNNKDVALVKLNNEWILFDNNGKQLFDFKDNIIFPSSENLFYLGIVKNTLESMNLSEIVWGIIDKHGKYIVPPRYLNIGNFSDDLFRVESGKGGFKDYGFYDLSIIKPIPGKWGFIDKQGNEVIPPQYNYAKDFSDGYAAVAMINEENWEENWGFINKQGKIVIPIQYNHVRNFKNGMAGVQFGKKWGIIDKTGKEIIPVKYDWIEGISNDDSEMEMPYEQYNYLFIYLNDFST